MPGIPICVYRPNIKKFQVTLSRGKIFFSGGFGVISPSPTEAIDRASPVIATSKKSSPVMSCEQVKRNESSSHHVTSLGSDSQLEKEICVENVIKELPLKDKVTSIFRKDIETAKNLFNEKNEMGEQKMKLKKTKMLCNDNNIFLFLEEVIYLYERGLLKVMREINNIYDNSKKTDLVPMLLPELFALLEDHDICLAAYITYAYLRSQTFIVLRHCDRTIYDVDGDVGSEVNLQKKQNGYQTDKAEKNEHAIHCNEQKHENHHHLHQQSHKHTELNQSNLNIDMNVSKNILEQKKMQNKRKKIERDRMRERVFNAQPPKMLYWNDNASSWRKDLTTHNENPVTSFPTHLKNQTAIVNNSNYEGQDINNKIDIENCAVNNQQEYKNTPLSFDVYKPNANFRRSDPGLPDFHVAVMDFSAPSPPFNTMRYLIDACANIPLRLAAVSDSGTVTMFAISSGEVPKIN